MVLRCDDCIKYHLGKCHEVGLKKFEIFELFSIATLIGGTIVVPHLDVLVNTYKVLKINKL